jgi:hypothetical protein
MYARLTDEGWSAETVDSQGNVGWQPSIALDSSDKPRISYYDLTNTMVKYARWTGATWSVENIGPAHVSYAGPTSIALDANNLPYIAHLDYVSGRCVLKYAAKGTPPQIAYGMVSYWKFDEGSGSTAFDSIGGNHGTIHGATWVTGKVKNALSFDGVNDYIEVSDSPSLDIANAITIEAWVYINRFPIAEPWYNMQVLQKDGTRYEHAYAMPILGELGYYHGWRQRPGLERPRRFGLELTLDGKWSGEMIEGSMWSNTPLEVRTWYHLVATFDGNQVKLYLNGQLDATYTISGTIETNDNPVRIGNWRRGGADYDFFNGIIDEVAIYNRALTAEEIRQHYQNGLNGVGYIATPP